MFILRITLVFLSLLAKVNAVDFGTPDLSNKWEHVVALAMEDPSKGSYKIFCSGVALSSHYILTAAHCIQPGLTPLSSEELQNFSRRLFIYTGVGAEEGIVEDSVYKVEEVILHPRYQRELRGLADLAVIKLSGDGINFNNQNFPSLINNFRDLRSYISNYSAVKIVGYGFSRQVEQGLLGTRAIEHFGIKHYGEIEVVERIGDEVRTVEIHERRRSSNRAASPRSGDSGGPLFVKTDNGSYQLVGVVSRAEMKRLSNSDLAPYLRPQVSFTLLFDRICWIQRHTNLSLLSEGKPSFCHVQQSPYSMGEIELNSLDFQYFCQGRDRLARDNETLGPAYTIYALQQEYNENDCLKLEEKMRHFFKVRGRPFINLSASKVWDLTPLYFFPELERITLRDNQILSISPLVRLIENGSSIRSLDISYNFISSNEDLDFMENNVLHFYGKNLQYQNIRHNNFYRLCLNRDLKSSAWPTINYILSQLELDSSGCWQANYDLIRQQSLDFRNIHGLRDMSALEGITPLRHLDLRGQNIQSLEFARSLVNLRELILDGNDSIDDFSPLKGLSLLHDLSLKNMNITDVTEIAQIRGLRRVNLEGNPILDITPLLRRRIQVLGISP